MQPAGPLPRGATWHARWVLPLVLLLGLLWMPWNDKPAPLLDPLKATKALAQWQAWTQRRFEMAQQAQEAKEKTLPSQGDGSVQVRIIPASAPR